MDLLNPQACGQDLVISMLSSFCIWCFDLWGPANPRGTAVLASSFMCKPANPELTLPTTSFFSSRTLGHYSPTLITQRPPGTRQQGTGPVSQEPLRLSRLAYPKPVYPALPVPSQENHTKCSCPHFYHSLCLLTDPGVCPCGPVSRDL